jgi:hypothetical protein
MTATSRAMIDETGSRDCAIRICSPAASRRPIGTRQDIAYQWRAVGYRGSRLMARRNSCSDAAKSQSWVAFMWANEVCDSAAWLSSITAAAALDAAFVQTSVGASTP